MFSAYGDESVYTVIVVVVSAESISNSFTFSAFVTDIFLLGVRILVEIIFFISAGFWLCSLLFSIVIDTFPSI